MVRVIAHSLSLHDHSASTTVGMTLLCPTLFACVVLVRSLQCIIRVSVSRTWILRIRCRACDKNHVGNRVSMSTSRGSVRSKYIKLGLEVLENVKKECIVRYSVVKMCGVERRL